MMNMDKPTSRRKKDPPLKRQCHRCNGTGLAPCRICAGRGKVMAGVDANGSAIFNMCSGCLGRKTGKCPTCNGEKFLS